MNNQFTIKEILIERAPGFLRGRFPEIKCLNSSLNVIWGPNGIGKTTLAKSLFSLLWKQKKTEKIEGIGHLECGEELWKSVVRDGSLTQVRLSDDLLIPLPGRNDEMSDMYWFSLSDFLSGDANRTEFHQKVYHEMQGGVDIDQAAENAGAIKKFTSGTNSFIKTAKSAKSQYKETLKLQAKVNELSEKIEKTKNEINSLEDSKKQQVHYEKALELKELNQTILNHKQEKEGFPKQIQNVSEYTYEKYEQLRDNLNKKIKENEKIKEEISRLEEMIKSCKVTAEELNNPSFESLLNELVSDLEEKNRENGERKKTFLTIESRLKAWEEEHRWLTAQLPIKDKLITSLDKLKQLSNDFESLRSKLAAMEFYTSFLGPKEEFKDTSELLRELKTRTCDLLEKYIAYESKQKGIELLPGVKKQLIIGVTLILLLALGLSMVYHPLFSLLSLFIPIVTWKVLPSKKQKSDVTDALDVLQGTQNKVNELLLALGGYPFEELNPEELSSLLREIEIQISSIEVGKMMNSERDAAEERYYIAQENLRNRYTEWEEACQDIGINPDNPKLDGAQFFNFSTHLKQWIDLIADREAAKASLDDAKNNFNVAMKHLNDFLNFDSDDIQQLLAEAKSLINRVEKACNYTDNLKSENKKLELVLGDRKDIENTLQEFWIEMDINPPNEDLLKLLSGRRKEWDRINQEIEFTNGRIESLKEEYPEAFRIYSEKSSEEIEAINRELTSKIEELPNLYDNLTDLRSSYKKLVEGSSLAIAEREYHQALHDLERLRQEQVLGRIVNMIATKVEIESRSFEVPEVLRQASSWLERITANRYQLRVNKDEFYAYDTVVKDNLSLEQLSDGTRIQLLFAIRMGFITVQEMSTDIRMPIFMDELLANSDDERALKIIDAVKEIAQNRQVFYFTAQADEVEKFRQHATEVFSDLSLDNLFKFSQVERYPLIQHVHIAPDLPKPNEDYYAYGNTLGVSSQSLWMMIEELHSWYLFNDGEVLYKYLTDGRVRVGQLDSSDEQIARRIDILRDAQRLARIGRCRSLTMGDLAESSIGLNTAAQYWQDIEQVLNDHQGSGKALMTALNDGSIKRVNTKTKQDIYDWMVENEFLTEEKEMNIDQILSNLLSIHASLTIKSDDYQIIERYLHQVIEN